MSEQTMPGLDEATLEETAERLQCADVGVDYPFIASTPDGDEYSAWVEQPHAEQERWRGLARLAYPVIAAVVREQVAQEIEIVMRRHDRAQVGFSGKGDAYADAAHIARGGAR